ncbi:uracil-DNA glycosylase family protein [Roseovarius aquimarinus]|uniref:Uracil DNA glycosylase superfamily protein n=1 Tax=Roseovarius aquimarinus TaxID=1229156 RepID=A0ABW7I9Z1_9RHOB
MIDACAPYTRAIAARRAFRLPDYPTLADYGFDGDYVSPIQIACGNLGGPLLISKDWLDAPSAMEHRTHLQRYGHLPDNPFIRVIDKALALLNLRREDIYITPVFHLLTPKRSSTIPAAHARASFDAIGRHELMGRRPVALGTDAANVLSHFGIDHAIAPHPSARIGSFDARAALIAKAIAS